MRLRLIIAALFLIVPLLEIFIIIQVGRVIGPWWTVGLLIVESLIGAWLIKREGQRAWRALRDSIGTGRLPGRELADAALVLVGGTLLLTPGFVTDIVGFFLVLPPTRPIARRMLSWFINRRAVAVTRRYGYDPAQATSTRRVVPGQIIDE
ncbi:MAG: FxsA family protein [Sporichthyaceae bacterium]|nr:FxsA family protein [Sporichthyaceae bacterium]